MKVKGEINEISEISNSNQMDNYYKYTKDNYYKKKINLKIFTKIMMKNRMTIEIDIMIWIKNKNSKLNLI